MRKISVLILMLSILIFPALCSAGSVNISSDFVIDRDMENGMELSSNWYMLEKEINLGDVSISPMIGVANSSLEGTAYGLDLKADTESNLAFGVKGKADVYNYDGYVFSLVGLYRRANLEVDEVTVNGSKFDMPLKNDATLQEWEIGTQVSKTFGNLTPYFGIAYNDAEIEYDIESFYGDVSETIDAEDNLGLRLGCSLEATDSVTIDINSKLVDQTSIGFDVTYKF